MRVDSQVANSILPGFLALSALRRGLWRALTLQDTSSDRERETRKAKFSRTTLLYYPAAAHCAGSEALSYMTLRIEKSSEQQKQHGGSPRVAN
jgi:hypothetical protein